MMFKTTMISILFLIALLFIFKDSGTTPVSHHAQPDPSTANYKNLVEMRMNVGLDTSPEALSRLYAEQGSNPGFALAEEQSILRRLSDIEGQIPNVKSTLPSENYGGIYIRSAENKIIVMLVHGTPELKNLITALAKFPDSIEFEEAQFTQAELENAQKELTANLNSIPDITSVGVNKNRLEIGFNLSEQQTVESRKQIKAFLNPQLLLYSFDLPPITF